MLLVKDSKTRFGFVSVFLHWYVAATIFFLLPTGATILYLGPHGPLRPLREDITWWHMSFAVTAIPFFLFRIFWRLRNGKPKTHTQHWTLRLTADLVWRLLLVLIVCQVFTGPGLELAHQYEIHWFGVTLIPVQSWIKPGATSFFHDAHILGATGIALLLVLHVAGALKHFVVNRDTVVQRILWPVVPEKDSAAVPLGDSQPAPLPAGE